MTVLLPRDKRRSRYLFDWSARACIERGSLDAITGQVAAYSRASIGRCVDANGVVQFAGYSQPRWQWEDRDGDGIRETAGLVLETSRQNLLTAPRDLTNAAWTKRGTAAVALTATGADGAANSASAITGLGGLAVNDLFVNSVAVPAGTRCEPSLSIKKVTATGTLSIINTQTSANGAWNVNLALLGTGWEPITRFHRAVTVVTEFSGTAGNVAGILFYCSAGGPLALNFDFVQLEIGTGSSSPIDALFPSRTRAADSLVFPLNFRPQPLTVAARYRTLDGGTVMVLGQEAGGVERMQIGNLAAFAENSVGGSAIATAPGTLKSGDWLELAGRFSPTATEAEGALNGGASGTAAAAGVAQDATFYLPQLVLTTNFSPPTVILERARIAAGFRSLAYMMAG